MSFYRVDDKVEKTCSLLSEIMWQKERDITDWEYIPTGYTGNRPPDGPWQPYAEGTLLQGKDKHFWFRTTLVTPKGRQGQSLYIKVATGLEGQWAATNPQGLLLLNGQITSGLDTNHTDVILEQDTTYEIAIYFYTGMTDACSRLNVSLYWQDQAVKKLYYDLSVPFQACRVLARSSSDYNSMMRVLEQCCNGIDFREPYSDAFYQSLEKAEALLEEQFYQELCGKNNPAIIHCIGHTHIDVAWLWTLEQTREKVQRSFATVLNLMKQYPEYRFMSSQPQLYQFVKEDAPELYSQIVERVKEGRWEVEGAMWLEADCNLSGGESLVRQVLYGKRFMKQEFSVDSEILWLPDVFGYSAALPQILKKSGVNHFVTSKISWNDTNKMPYDTFDWQGIDGTDVRVSFITTRSVPGPGQPDRITDYNGQILVSQVLGTWHRYQQKEYNNELFHPFGFGDGGGGPTAEMLERQRRLTLGLPGFPKTVINKVGKALKAANDKFDEGTRQLKRIPKWVGELYLEYHRGTYTSMAKSKKYNRQSEHLLLMTETASIINRMLCGGVYPKDRLPEHWRTVLLNQFHDIIPGSSIKEVYDCSHRQYEELLADGKELLNRALCSLAQEVKTEGGLFVYNPLSHTRSGTVMHEGKHLWVEDIPAFGWKVVVPEPTTETIVANENKLENKNIAITFDDKGDIVSLWDKTYCRELVKKGETLNSLIVCEDYPKEYDAWELASYHTDKWWPVEKLISATTVREGARSGIRFVKKYLNSTITQTVYLYEQGNRIDFVTEVDWNETHQMLKAVFPLDIQTDKVTYEIQFGHLERPSHRNTSWDEARFEVCGHKWADLSENGYGVSLLNDCKYGYSALGNTLSLSLIKSPTYPNPVADQGHHSFTYALLPHAGGFPEGGTVSQAYDLNVPLLAMPLNKQEGSLSEQYSFIQCDKENIIIETIKQAEDGERIIIRFYEAFCMRTTVTLTFGFDVKAVYVCDMLENECRQLSLNENSVTMDVGCFEIVTLAVE